jgi:hypothetical protein
VEIDIAEQFKQPRLCSICKREGCSSKKCTYCRVCFKPPGTCLNGEEILCGTSEEEVREIVKARNAEATAYKSRQKAKKQRVM